MYPHERSLVRHLAGKPFAIIGVNSDAPLDRIRQITNEKKLTWRSFWNGPDGVGGPISTEWNVASWPTTYLLDREGVIRYKYVRGKSLDRAIEQLMAEMGEQVKLVEIDHESEDALAMADESPSASGSEKSVKDD